MCDAAIYAETQLTAAGRWLFQRLDNFLGCATSGVVPCCEAAGADDDGITSELLPQLMAHPQVCVVALNALRVAGRIGCVLQRREQRPAAVGTPHFVLAPSVATQQLGRCVA